MLTAQILTDRSWILQDSTGENIGLISYNTSKEKYLLVTPDMDVDLDSFDELSTILGSKIKIKERKTVTETFKDIDGFAICHETAEDVEHLEGGLIKYKPGGQSKKSFYAGYWVTLMPEGNWIRRASLSLEMHEEFTSKKGVHGPYKDKIEANFMVKKLNDKK